MIQPRTAMISTMATATMHAATMAKVTGDNCDGSRRCRISKDLPYARAAAAVRSQGRLTLSRSAAGRYFSRKRGLLDRRGAAVIEWVTSSDRVRTALTQHGSFR